MRYIFPVTPVGKPRMTQRDKWQKRPEVERYWAYKDALQLAAAAFGFRAPDSGMGLTFLLPMPRSWSKKKRNAMRGQPHQQKPDRDNLEKAFLDSLRDGDDHQVWHTAWCQKFWADEGAIIIDITTPKEESWVSEAPIRGQSASVSVTQRSPASISRRGTTSRRSLGCTLSVGSGSGRS